jgi:hypothetical protein
MLGKMGVFFPVFGLTLDDNIGNELRFKRVLFVSAKKIPKIRKRLGIPEVISFYKKKFTKKDILSEANTYAWVPFKWSEKRTDIAYERRLAQNAVWILASSLFSRYDRHRFRLSLTPNIDNRIHESAFLFNLSKPEMQSSRGVFDPIEDYNLGKLEYSFLKGHFFNELIEVNSTSTPIKAKWLKLINRAASLAGRSYLADTLSDAFMYVMIAIEVLLSQQGDKHRVVIANRINSFFSWYFDNNDKRWKNIVNRLYNLRCDLVHDGTGENLNGLDLYYAEILLRNLLRNICMKPYRFPAKQAIADHARKVEARRVLELPLFTKDEGFWFSKRSIAHDAEEVKRASWSIE